MLYDGYGFQSGDLNTKQ